MLVLLALLAPLVVGLLVFRDYGIPWDEPIQRSLGAHAWRYVFDSRSAYASSSDRFYGVAYEMTLYGAERALGIAGNSRGAFLLRHAVNFVVFWLAGLSIFDLVRRRLGSTALGLVAFGLLFSSPRVFADAFYNTKDLGFLSAFVVGMWTLDRFVARPRFWLAVGHGLVCAFATNIRLAGALLPAMTVCAFALVERDRGREGRLARLAVLGCCLTTASVALVAFWPFLWGDPVSRFLESLSRMAHYPWGGEVLFDGRRIPASDLPWTYIPVWIALTTPLAVLALLAVGLWRACHSLVAPASGARTSRVWSLILLVWLLGPLALVIGLRSALYDGWRQLYFLYPAIALFATLGVEWAGSVLRSQAPVWRRALAGAALAWLAIDVTGSVAWMIRWHPHQNVYFNAAAGSAEQVSRRFELDYWGLGCRRALEQILASDARPQIALYVPTEACWSNVRILTPAERDRLERVDYEGKADYVVEHYRHLPPTTDPPYAVRVDGLLIASARPVEKAPAP